MTSNRGWGSASLKRATWLRTDNLSECQFIKLLKGPRSKRGEHASAKYIIFNTYNQYSYQPIIKFSIRIQFAADQNQLVIAYPAFVRGSLSWVKSYNLVIGYYVCNSIRNRRRWHVRPFSHDNCLPEVAYDVMSGLAAGEVSSDVKVKYGGITVVQITFGIRDPITLR